MLFRRRPQPFMYHVAPKRSNVVVSHIDESELEEALKPLPVVKVLSSKRNADMHPVSTGRKEGMRKSHWFEDEWDVRERAGNGWKAHRSTQYR